LSCAFLAASPATAPLQHHEALSAPAASTATRNKLLAAPLSSLGLAFARLAEPQQQQLQAQLLQLVGPQLPHLNDKQLRKKLLQEPKDKLLAMQDSRDRLMEALPAVRGAAAGGAGARLVWFGWDECMVGEGHSAASGLPCWCGMYCWMLQFALDSPDCTGAMDRGKWHNRGVTVADMATYGCLCCYGVAPVPSAGAGVEGNASDDDFQAHWSASAEDALVAAWNAAKAAAGQQGVSQLALDVCTALGNTAVQVGGARQQDQSACCKFSRAYTWQREGSRQLFRL
jgi:hypothetical protein